MNISADIFQNRDNDLWTARLFDHPIEGGDGKLVWEKCDCAGPNMAEISMEKAYKDLTEEKQ